MKKRTEKIKDQLGLPLGTATHRLRKMVMYELVKQVGLDVCFRCQKNIESIDELSIEHKESWFDSDKPKELFFSLDNIAFSHLKCNTNASKQSIRNKKNKSGFKGVEFDKRRGKYRAKIWDGEKFIRSGYCNTPIEASNEYTKLSVRLFK